MLVVTKEKKKVVELAHWWLATFIKSGA